MSYLFDIPYYIDCKLVQLKSVGEKDPRTGEDYTRAGLYKAIADAGLTVREHYETYGRSEKLNPNPYFNEYEYLEAKAQQLNSVGEQPNPAGGPWDAKAVLKAITEAGMIPAEHYEIYGAFERDAQGNFINPSNALDANAYWSAKLLQLQTEEPERKWTMDTMLDAFKESGVSPVSHYQLWGADEADAGGIPFVQTVPVSQRVPNDPARDDVTGDTVPGNYMDATPPPTDGNAAAVQNPCDVGGLADEHLSPAPAYPNHSLPVPGDKEYLPLPPTIKPGPGVIILPPSREGDKVSDKWLVVDTSTGKATVVGNDGEILGQTDVTVTDSNGSQTVTLPPSSDVPVADLPPLNPDTLPPSITPDPDLPNHFPDPTPDPGPPPPPPDPSGITATAENGSLTLAGSIHSSGSSMLSLDGKGMIETWTGVKSGAAKPADGLSANGVLDAAKVTGTGTLTLDTTKLAQEHTVIGSASADNQVYLGKATGYSGGAGKDSLTISGTGTTVTGLIDLGSGTNTFVMDAFSGKVDKGSGTTAILGGDGDDTVTIKSGTVTGLTDLGNGTNIFEMINGSVENDNAAAIRGGTGKDSIVLKDGTVTGDITLGDGDDTVTFAYKNSDAPTSGVTVTGCIDLGDGTNSLNMINGTLNAGHKTVIKGGTGADSVIMHNDSDFINVTGTISLGEGNDKVDIKGVQINGGSAVELGDGDDTLTINGLAQGSGMVDIRGGAGADTMNILGLAAGGHGKVNVRGGAGDDTITLESGPVNLVFEENGTDNGVDTINGFIAGAGTGSNSIGGTPDQAAHVHVLDFFGDDRAIDDKFNLIVELIHHQNTSDYYASHSVIRIISPFEELTAADISARSKQGKLTLADNTVVVALVVSDLSDGAFNVYEVRDANMDVDVQDWQVTLMGVVTLREGSTFEDLTIDNIA